MVVRAAFFDVGDTLVEQWAPREVVNERARAQICAGLGEERWLDELLDVDDLTELPRIVGRWLAG